MARSMMKRGLAEGLSLPQIEIYEPSKPDEIEKKEITATVTKEPEEKQEIIASEKPINEETDHIEEEKQSKRGRKPGVPNKTKKEPERAEEQEKKIDTTRQGLPNGWKRNSFVFNEENLELVKCYAFDNKMKEKDVINQALNEFFDRHPVRKR